MMKIKFYLLSIVMLMAIALSLSISLYFSFANSTTGIKKPIFDDYLLGYSLKDRQNALEELNKTIPVKSLSKEAIDNIQKQTLRIGIAVEDHKFVLLENDDWKQRLTAYKNNEAKKLALLMDDTQQKFIDRISKYYKVEEEEEEEEIVFSSQEESRKAQRKTFIKQYFSSLFKQSKEDRIKKKAINKQKNATFS